jgi:hypothetical protein
MKKVFNTLLDWIKSIFTKKQVQNEVHLPKKLSKDAKKKIVTDFNKKREVNNQASLKNSVTTTGFAEEMLKVYEQNVTKTNNVISPDEHREILNITIRSEKPKFSNKPEFLITSNKQQFQITEKQYFFVTKMIELQDSTFGVDMKKICENFMLMKFGKVSFEELPKHVLMPKYHKKTINYLAKIGVIVRLNKTHYLFVV